MVRQPPDLVLAALRDELTGVGRHMEGIEEIRALEWRQVEDSLIETVHEWRAAASLASALRGRLDAGAMTWIERAIWNSNRGESRWTVESQLLGSGLVGSGTTRIEPAMGGRGSRLNLEVTTTIGSGSLGPIGVSRWKAGIEDAAATLLAKTLQELGRAVELFIETEGRDDVRG